MSSRVAAHELSARLDAAIEMALAAGNKTLEYFQRDNFVVEKKADRSPVTIADQAAETLLRQHIQRVFPHDGIVGEEFGESPGTSGFRWILDPIDGTKSFIYGVPLYGTLVGVEYDRQSVIGVINVAALNECVYAATGHGCWLLKGGAAPRETRVSQTASLADGLLVTSQVDSFDSRGAAAAWQALQEKAYVTRTWGDCYGYLLVATGRATVMVDPEMNVWDAAALQPILQEAGGSFTDWRGTATIYGGEAIGTNGRVLEEVLEITRPFAKPA